MAPLGVYGIQDALGVWTASQGDPGVYRDFFSYVHGSWIYMELATIAAALLALRFYPFPFILLVASIAAWFLSMDIAMWFHRDIVELRRLGGPPDRLDGVRHHDDRARLGAGYPPRGEGA